MDFLSAYAPEIWAAIIGVIGGAAVSIPITVRVTRNSMGGSSTNVNQSGARSGGDMIGRDKVGR